MQGVQGGGNHSEELVRAIKEKEKFEKDIKVLQELLVKRGEGDKERLRCAFLFAVVRATRYPDKDEKRTDRRKTKY